MLLKLFQGKGNRGFLKNIHTQMCITSLFGQQHHCKIENEWNDDDDEQKQIFYEEEKNISLGTCRETQRLGSPLTPCPYLKGGVRGEPTVPFMKQQFKCNVAKCSDLVHCKCENKPETYFIQYEGGVGILSR